VADIVFVVDAYSWQYVTTRQHISVSEDELQEALDILDSSLNPLGVDAIELRDYLDGRGQLTLRVELANQQQMLRNLLERVSHCVSQGDSRVEVLGVKARDDGQLERVQYQRAFVRISNN
jgi:DNA-directed RNA polymerase specialized sigma54-like protein